MPRAGGSCRDAPSVDLKRIERWARGERPHGEERFQEFEPYLVYLRVLWERYGEDLQKEADETALSKIRLTTFQNDGIVRAMRIAAQYNGVLFCDGVGLGKSFVAGER